MMHNVLYAHTGLPAVCEKGRVVSRIVQQQNHLQDWVRGKKVTKKKKNVCEIELTKSSSSLAISVTALHFFS